MVRVAAARSSAFSANLAKASWSAESAEEGALVRRVGRQVEQDRTCGLDRLANTADLVCPEVVHDDHICGRELGHQHLLDIGAEGITMHGTIHHHRCCEPADPQACG